ncbi:MAG: SIS domain-containing protein, partial [Candidatus Pacebacteria bacterium]|nr:SIS domain-containing protein [Candidatus Paceibacterota bacterium]
MAEIAANFTALQKLAPQVTAAAAALQTAAASRQKILLCGNGGSAADAQHLAAELTGRYERERQPYPAIALTVDSSALTAIGNDYGFTEIFARQVRAYGSAGDVLIAISTSGRSANVVAA